VQREHTQYLGAVPPRAGGFARATWEVATVLVLYRALLPVSDSGMQAQWYVPGDGKDEVTKDNESFRTILLRMDMEYHKLLRDGQICSCVEMS
jgi:hypothetical protein